MKKRIVYAGLVFFCLCSCNLKANVEQAPIHPALAIMQHYQAELVYMDFFEPYTVSLLALNQLEYGESIPEVKNFIQWYFEHLNYPDKNGLTGTIYDYVLRDGQEWSTGEYDSIDGYSGVFLYLLNKYVIATDDTQILTQNWDKIDDVVYTIIYMQDEQDGLTRALPTTDQKYLMDNCESYIGIKSYNQLRQHADKGKSDFYETAEEELKNAVLGLYSSSYHTFIWVVEDGQPHESVWDNYYPDSYAQLFPIYYEILDDNPVLARDLWDNFNLYHAGNANEFPVEQKIIYELTRKKIDTHYQ